MHVAVNVGNIGQRGAAYVFYEEVACVRTCAVAELLQYQKCPVP